MKKTYRIPLLALFQATLLLGGAIPSFAGEYPEIPPHTEFSLGWTIIDDTDGPRPSYASSLNLSRPGTKNAVEYWDTDSSPYIEGHIELFPFPNRFYGEVEYFGDDEWFGELRHAYKDLFTIRDVSRSFSHNLSNLTLYNFGGTAVTQQDRGTEYGIAADIHQFRMRLKTPDFPFHLYGLGDIVKRSGNRQQRFLGGTAYFSGPTRVAESRNIDTTSQSITLGANSHLGWLEMDYAHTWQDFSADADSTMYYAYSTASGTRASGIFPHNNIPEIVGRKDVLKLHSNYTGQVTASASFADIVRTNNTSGAEADRFLGHGEILWTPMANLSVGAKMRHQDDESDAPASVSTGYRNPSTGALFGAVSVNPGVEASTDTFTGFVRYSPVNKVTLNGQYIKQIKEVEDQSAIEWHRPTEKDTDTVELGAGWRALSTLRVNAKYTYRDTSIDPGEAIIINAEPEKEHQVKFDATWNVTPMTTVYVSGSLRDASADNFQQLTGTGTVVTDARGNRANRFDSLSQQYLASVSHALNSRLSVNATYAYLVANVDRNIGLDYAPDPDAIDTGYSHKLDSHHVSVGGLFHATEMLNIEASLEYITGRGDYMLTDGIALRYLPIGDISRTETQEFGARLEGEYDFGNSWKGGLILRYVDFTDSSFDNPAESDAFGVLAKVTKVFQ